MDTDVEVYKFLISDSGLEVHCLKRFCCSQNVKYYLKFQTLKTSFKQQILLNSILPVRSGIRLTPTLINSTDLLLVV